MNNVALKYIFDAVPNFPIMICQSDNGLPNVNVTLQEDTAWLRTTQMAELFQCDRL